jgi:uncharacterized membrane protein
MQIPSPEGPGLFLLDVRSAYERTATVASRGRKDRQMLLIGKLHPLLVHFPIGLVLSAAAAEIVAICSGRAAWRAIAVANVRAGAAMGAITAIAGWGLASAAFVEPSRLLTWHRWTGVAGAAMAISAALLSPRSHVESQRSLVAYQIALFGAAIVVAVAGHLGGTLVWGADFLRQ